MNENDIEKQLSELTLPEVQMNEHKNISKKRMTQMRNTPFLGVIVVILLGMIANEGVANLKKFADIPSLIIVTVIPFSLLITSYGLAGLRMVFTAPFEMNASGELRDAYISVMKDLRIYSIVSGAIGAFIGIILVFNDQDILTRELPNLLPVFGLAMMTVLYGLFIAYFYAYPLQKRFEHN